ncbi:MAG: hypothetical protein SGI92_00400 [Bryobacteraceae bacterium]|nr:hypothetical protein [Bryobacteraceae bacterium]
MTSTAEVCLRKIAVLDSSGKHLFWATEEEARQLKREGECELLGTKRRIHALRFKGQHPAALASRIRTGTQYSHRRETRQNPVGCWTLVEIPESCRDMFTAVHDQCLKKAA